VIATHSGSAKTSTLYTYINNVFNIMYLITIRRERGDIKVQTFLGEAKAFFSLPIYDLELVGD